MADSNLSSALNDIGQTLNISNVTSAVSAVLRTTTKNQQQMTEVVTQVMNVKDGINEMLSGDYTKKAYGLMRIVCAVRILATIIGPHVKEFSRFVYSVLVSSNNQSNGSLCSNQTGQNVKTTDAVTTIILESVEEKEDELLRANAEGVCRSLSFVLDMIDGVCKGLEKPPSGSEISHLLEFIDINGSIRALGEIKSRIKSMMETKLSQLSENTLCAHSRQVIKYINMYCHVAILRDTVLWQLYAMLASSEDTVRLAKGIETSLEREHERDRDLVKALVLPDQNQVQIASFYDPNSWPFINKFMEDCRLFSEIENLHNIPVVMNVMKWLHLFLTHDKCPKVCLRAQNSLPDKPPDKTIHNFVFIKKIGSACYYISPQGQRDMYAVMNEKKWVELQNGKPGKEGEWNILNVQDAKSVYMLSTRRWPFHFMRVSDTWKGWIQGQIVPVSDPKAQWIIQYNGSNK